MRQAHLGRRKSCGDPLLKATVTLLMMTGCFPEASLAQDPGQKTFTSPDAATMALVTAVRSGNENAMLDVLGSRAERLVSSGDATEDALERANFVQRYEQMHRFVNEPDGTTTLYIGAANWPTPIPLAHAGQSWYFDTEAGNARYCSGASGATSCLRSACASSSSRPKRNITRSDTTNMHARSSALRERTTASTGRRPMGKPKVRSGRWLPGQCDGDASEHSDDAPVPFRGYYYHILSSQGAKATGGAHSYLVKER